jgi:hypothetical protein
VINIIDIKVCKISRIDIRIRMVLTKKIVNRSEMADSKYSFGRTKEKING